MRPHSGTIFLCDLGHEACMDTAAECGSPLLQYVVRCAAISTVVCLTPTVFLPFRRQNVRIRRDYFCEGTWGDFDPQFLFQLGRKQILVEIGNRYGKRITSARIDPAVYQSVQKYTAAVVIHRMESRALSDSDLLECSTTVLPQSSYDRGQT